MFKYILIHKNISKITQNLYLQMNTKKYLT